jgi:hypothetical protein
MVMGLLLIEAYASLAARSTRGSPDFLPLFRVIFEEEAGLICIVAAGCYSGPESLLSREDHIV